MSHILTTSDIPLRTVVGGVGFTNLFSPNTPVNPDGWLLLRQFTRNGTWYPAVWFSLSSTYSALLWFVRARHAMGGRDAGHDGVRLVFMDGTVLAAYIKFATPKHLRDRR